MKHLKSFQVYENAETLKPHMQLAYDLLKKYTNNVVINNDSNIGFETLNKEGYNILAQQDPNDLSYGMLDNIGDQSNFESLEELKKFIHEKFVMDFLIWKRKIEEDPNEISNCPIEVIKKLNHPLQDLKTIGIF